MKYYIVRYKIQSVCCDIVRYKVCYEGIKNKYCFMKSFSTLSSAKRYCKNNGLIAEYVKEEQK